MLDDLGCGGCVCVASVNQNKTQIAKNASAAANVKEQHGEGSWTFTILGQGSIYKSLDTYCKKIINKKF